MAAVNLHPDTIDNLQMGYLFEWKDQKTQVENEHKQMGFTGRFGAGLPAI
jgi:hypothetical protein